MELLTDSVITDWTILTASGPCTAIRPLSSMNSTAKSPPLLKNVHIRKFEEHRLKQVTNTVPAPINGAACIQKLFFDPSDYHIKMT